MHLPESQPIRYAAIDIGSNAVRLLIADIVTKDGKPAFKKNTLVRVPLRLGSDAFIAGAISAEKSNDLTQTMAAFKTLMDVYKVQDYRACATSAMRDASNGSALVSSIRDIGINLEIIDGAREAEIIYGNRLDLPIEPAKVYLFVDVGGGSTEISLFGKHGVLDSRSFNIGTIRMLSNGIPEREWLHMRRWLIQITSTYKKTIVIGTGGNINKLFSLSGQKEGQPLSFAKLKNQYDRLITYTLTERIDKLGLKADRADVIVPAARIFLNIMKWSNSHRVMIPRLGLVDGLIHKIIEKNNPFQD